jgi:hypothetical protein
MKIKKICPLIYNNKNKNQNKEISIKKKAP